MPEESFATRFMNKINISTIEDINVARVKSENGSAGAKKAFNILESRMNGLKGRKMYGVFYPNRGEYFACVKLDEEHPDDMGFERAVILGGEYAKEKIENWTSKIPELGSVFKVLAEECKKCGYEVDSSRPSIEFYRSFTELILMVPVR